MPKIALKETFELKTRNDFTKADAELLISISSKELPSMGVVGEALEKAHAVFQEAITNSYKVIPERV